MPTFDAAAVPDPEPTLCPATHESAEGIFKCAQPDTYDAHKLEREHRSAHGVTWGITPAEVKRWREEDAPEPAPVRTTVTTRHGEWASRRPVGEAWTVRLHVRADWTLALSGDLGRVVFRDLDGVALAVDTDDGGHARSLDVPLLNVEVVDAFIAALTEARAILTEAPTPRWE